MNLLKKTLLSLVAFNLASSQASAAPTAPSATAKSEPIKIGFIVPLSSVAGAGGEEMVKGIELYLEHIKHKAAGRPIELIIENDESSPATGMAKANKLIDQDHVQVLGGFLLSNVTAKVAAIAESKQIPAVLAVSSGDDFTQRKRLNYVVRTSWTASQGAHPIGEWMYNKKQFKKIAMLGVDYSVGWEMLGGAQQTFEAAGGQVVQKLFAPLGIKDFAPFIKQLRPDVDAVFMAAAVGPAEIIARQYEEFGPKKPAIGAAAVFDEECLPKLTEKSAGSFNYYYYSPNINTAGNKKFVKAFNEKYKTGDPSHFAEAGYTSGMWIVSAIEAINGNVEDKEKFLAALKKVELKDAPRGPIKLDSFNNPIENIYVMQVKSANGKLHNEIVDQFKAVSQFGKVDAEQYLKQPSYSREFPPCTNCK